MLRTHRLLYETIWMVQVDPKITSATLLAFPYPYLPLQTKFWQLYSRRGPVFLSLVLLLFLSGALSPTCPVASSTTTRFSLTPRISSKCHSFEEFFPLSSIFYPCTSLNLKTHLEIMFHHLMLPILFTIL